MTWDIVFPKQAQKDAKMLASAGLKPKAQKLPEIIRENPFQKPAPYEKLIGDLVEAFIPAE